MNFANLLNNIAKIFFNKNLMKKQFLQYFLANLFKKNIMKMVFNKNLNKNTFCNIF